MWSLILLFIFAGIVSWLITYPLVILLKFLSTGQAIRVEGPASHQNKAGTPTMAGIGFILAILILSVIFINVEIDWRYLALSVLMAAFALIGFLDDWLKVIRKQNLGLTFWQKLLSQIIVASIFVIVLLWCGQHQTLHSLLAHFGLNNPILYFIFAVFVVVGGANATNLTDGLNGLLAGTGGIAFLAMALLAMKLGLVDATTFALIASGAILTFLYFNFPKAQVFMGDVGSLAIGAALAGLALIIHSEFRLIIIGGIFVAETLSVIIQVTSYKLFRKRVFKMSPLHHHFELLGFKEKNVVIGFWVVAAVLGIVGVLM
jgi:phospho-N-acetylmuramoyl-pentapeptide-transferase